MGPSNLMSDHVWPTLVLVWYSIKATFNNYNLLWEDPSSPTTNTCTCWWIFSLCRHWHLEAASNHKWKPLRSGIHWLSNEMAQGLCHTRSVSQDDCPTPLWIDHLLIWYPWTVIVKGANFLSELILEIFEVLGVKKLNISRYMYHLQTDGLVKKFNLHPY